MRIPILSFFCGCGGLDLGFQEADFDIVLALDSDPVAVKTYNHNHGAAVAKVADLSTLSGQAIADMLEPSIAPRGIIGGPPCQPFSNGNVFANENDVRRQLPGIYANLLAELNSAMKIDFFLFENVQGISFKRHEALFSHFKGLFEDAGFILFEGLLDARDFGVAQSRPRVFVVGYNEDRYGGLEYTFPTGNTGAKTVRDVIGNLPEPTFFERGLGPEDITPHPNHWTMNPRSDKFTDGSLEEGRIQGRSFRVLAWDRPSWTVAYGNREIHIHPSCKRRLSIYEAMLLQGLPKDYELLGTLSDQVRQVSDAVPPPTAKALAESIAHHLV